MTFDGAMTALPDPLFPMVIPQEAVGVLLVNEGVRRVLGPGVYRRRAFGRVPITGRKRLITLLRAEQLVPFTAESVLLKPEQWGGPGAPRSSTDPSVTIDVQLSARTLPDNLKRLGDAVGQYTPDSFPEQALLAVQEAAEVNLRRYFAQLTYAETRQAGHGERLDLSGVSVLEGLVEIAHVRRVDVRADPHLEELLKIERDRERKEHELHATLKLTPLEDDVAMAQAHRERLLEHAKLAKLRDISRATGTPLKDLVEPDSAAKRLEIYGNALQAALSNPEIVAMLNKKDPAFLRGLLEEVRPSTIDRADEKVIPTPALAAADAPQLLVQRPLDEVFESLGLGGDVRGAAYTDLRRRDLKLAEVVVVSDAPEYIRARERELTSAVSDALDVTKAAWYFLESQSTVSALLSVFFNTVLPGAGQGGERLEVTGFAAPGRLEIRVALDDLDSRVLHEIEDRAALLRPMLGCDIIDIRQA